MTKLISAMVIHALRDIDIKDREPAKIIFNTEGRIRALSEARACDIDPRGTTYMGLPFAVDPRQAEEVRVLDTQQVEGGVHVSVPIEVGPVTYQTATVTLVGRAMSKAQLCDIIKSYTEAHPNSTFSVMLNDAVRRYGRFE